MATSDAGQPVIPAQAGIQKTSRLKREPIIDPSRLQERDVLRLDGQEYCGCDGALAEFPQDQLDRDACASKNVSVNKLIEEFSTAALAEFDAETRFLARSARGNVKRGLALLDKIDRARRAARA